MKKSNSINHLTHPSFLSDLFNAPVCHVEKQNLKTSGFSGSWHEKVVLKLENEKTIPLILKHIVPSQDMTIWRSGNIGNREAMLLDDQEMGEIWNIFQSPYIAYAMEDENSALLMHDVSPYLFPDVREPILPEQEDFILEKLAQMHACFWQHKILSKKWLAKQSIFFNFLGPLTMAEEKAAGRKHPLFDVVQNGWDLVQQLLPADINEFILHPPIEKMTEGLPKTLIHGDSKLANFAIMPEKKLCAFDWSLTASASPAIEIGWYVAVNASRLARSKEEVMNRYREFLQSELHFTLENKTWNQMVSVAVLTGAEILLWNKALNLQKNIPGAKEEWDWWTDNIRRIY